MEQVIYLILRNADMTEGRGPMVPINVAFESWDQAVQYVEAQEGVQGCRGEKYSEVYRGANDHMIREIWLYK